MEGQNMIRYISESKFILDATNFKIKDRLFASYFNLLRLLNTILFGSWNGKRAKLWAPKQDEAKWAGKESLSWWK